MRDTSLGRPATNRMQKAGQQHCCAAHCPTSLFATPNACISQFDLAHRSRAIAAIKIATADADVSHSHKFSDLSKYAIVPWLLIE